jgi:hypothetical protein
MRYSHLHRASLKTAVNFSDAFIIQNAVNNVTALYDLVKLKKSLIEAPLE